MGGVVFKPETETGVLHRVEEDEVPGYMPVLLENPSKMSFDRNESSS